jgi:CRP-like cAMP-binding protein
MQQLLDNIGSIVNLTLQEKEKISEKFRPFFLRRKKDLLRSGDICKDIAFVNRGCVRSYAIDENGHEHVLQLAFENHWISDLYSFLLHEPTTLFIEAIEDSKLLLISNEHLEQLYTEVPKMERFFRILIQRAYVTTLQRLEESFSEPAAVRYNALIEKNPNLLQRVPLIFIASYLGITPESLSRIRKQK